MKTILKSVVRLSFPVILALATLCFTSPCVLAQQQKSYGMPSFNTVLGTQAIGGRYHFTKEPPLVEAARAILSMGSNTLKFSLVADKSDGVEPKSLAEIVLKAKSIKTVLGLPFASYLFWAYPISTSADRFQLASLPDEYKEMYALTRTLLQTYAGTGKTFYLGNWEGDWHLTHEDPNYVPTDQEVQNMTAWVNIRQKAVDTAKRDTPHSGVQVFYYLELNRVVDAMQGKVRIANAVLPRTPVDFVSYSSYDSLDGDIGANLQKSLDYLQANLPAKPGVPGKRVFIGEYGFAAHGITPEEQDARTRQVMQAGLQWGCPFILYWEMYNNEVGKSGEQTGYWLIDDHNTKQPVYFTHQRFYRQAQEYLASFQKSHGRAPTPEEFSRSAIPWLTWKPAPTAEDLRERSVGIFTSAR